jgi:hypothetical protein
MQFLSWLLFMAFLIVYGSTVSWLIYMVYGLLAINLVFNLLNLIPVFKVFRPDYNYKQWLRNGNTIK